MNNLSLKIKKRIPQTFKNNFKRFRDVFYWDNYFQKSWSQEGEDLVLQRFFEGKKEKGFFIDVGAHHPYRFSNTYKFYLKGWRGINIDAMPGSMKLFNEKRTHDINLEIAISDNEELLTFFIFNEPALNTFSADNANNYLKSHETQLIEKKSLQTKRLADIISNHLPPNTPIDFLTIDVEGLDLNVLKSNDWTCYRPQLVLVEYLDFNSSEFFNSTIYKFMGENGYEFYAKTCNTVFFTKDKK